MKNIHVLPTDKPSRLHLGNSGLVLCDLNFGKNTINGQHIYITSDEEIKEGDYRLNIQRGYYKKADKEGLAYYNKRNDVFKKIILTTDQSLDGVQAIDDKFLEWFVKNPSCEKVEIIPSEFLADKVIYEINIPQEEPKQGTTLEEAAKESFKNSEYLYDFPKYELGFIAGAKWQAERMYSEEDMENAIEQTVLQCNKKLQSS